jgi:hypothetical protein
MFRRMEDRDLKRMKDGWWWKNMMRSREEIFCALYEKVYPRIMSRLITDSLKPISVDPVLISRGDSGTSRSSSGASSPQASSPPVSPSKPSISSTSGKGGADSTPAQNLLKLAVSQSLTDKSVDKGKVIQPFSMGSLNLQNRPALFRKGVQSRDQVCVITGTEAELCEASDIIPHALIRVSLFGPFMLTSTSSK